MSARRAQIGRKQRLRGLVSFGVWPEHGKKVLRGRFLEGKGGVVFAHGRAERFPAQSLFQPVEEGRAALVDGGV